MNEQPAPDTVDPIAGIADPVSTGAEDASLAGLERPERDGGDESLLAIVDRLALLLERSDLVELEVEAGATALLLRKPQAPAGVAPQAAPGAPAAGAMPPAVAGSPADAASANQSSGPSDGPASDAESPPRPSVKAPLTGIWYASPAPGIAPYVHIGGEVVVGQVIGLIEAMKLFNEIKSDLSGRVARVLVDTGSLVKAKQPLIEVEQL